MHQGSARDNVPQPPQSRACTRASRNARSSCAVACGKHACESTRCACSHMHAAVVGASDAPRNARSSCAVACGGCVLSHACESTHRVCSRMHAAEVCASGAPRNARSSLPENSRHPSGQLRAIAAIWQCVAGSVRCALRQHVREQCAAALRNQASRGLEIPCIDPMHCRKHASRRQ